MIQTVAVDLLGNANSLVFDLENNLIILTYEFKMNCAAWR